jgi:CDP-diacylglycerol--glycerol-3-phosphate 3-phosphatidyltransferase
MTATAMNLPNALTMGRIFLIPILVVVLLTNPKDLHLFGFGKELMGALIFGVASFTDWLDGFLARRRNQVTPFGQWMDPLADKLLVTAALISLVQMELAPAWMVAVILGREYAVTVLRSVAHARGHALPASPLGKLKMAAQVAAILLLILGRAYLQEWVVIGHFALWVATIAALVSAVDYFRKYTALVNGRPATAPESPRPSSSPAPRGTPAVDDAPATNRVNV